MRAAADTRPTPAHRARCARSLRSRKPLTQCLKQVPLCLPVLASVVEPPGREAEVSATGARGAGGEALKLIRAERRVSVPDGEARVLLAGRALARDVGSKTCLSISRQALRLTSSSSCARGGSC